MIMMFFGDDECTSTERHGLKEDAVSPGNPLRLSVPSDDKIVIDFDFFGKNGAGK